MADVVGDPVTAPIASSGQKGVFANRVTAVFSTKVVAFALSFATTLIIARILGRDGKGAYVNVLAVPGLIGAVGVFGLPNAINYFSARGTSVRGLLGAGLVLTAVLSAILMPILWFSLPWLETNMFSDAAKAYPDQLRIIFLVVPAALLSSFGMAVLYGRQQTRTYSTILIGQGVLTFTLSTVLVAVFRFGVPGAVVSSIVVTWLLALADVFAVGRLSRREPAGKPVSYRGLAGYGFRIYPASITGYFNYRIDVLILIPTLMPGQVGALGLYSIAVTMAELIFYIPDSVTMVFLPRIAGLSKEDADALVGRVSRLTFLLTGAVALALVPGAWLGLHLLLPGFTDCLPAFYILLPAVMCLSLSKVMTSYIAGRGRPGLISVGSAVAVAVNIGANILLIPRFGIAGASLASLVSYASSAAILLTASSRLSGRSLVSLVVPGPAEVRLVAARVRVMATRALARVRGARPGATPGAAPGAEAGTPQ
jgi:O-antigen/teichoic acid export membrane protein